MKLEVLYRIEGYKTLIYNIDDSILEEYCKYCQDNKLDQKNSSTVIRFLYDSGIEFDEDYEITDETLEDYSKEIFNFIEKANDINRSKTEISRNNSEAE